MVGDLPEKTKIIALIGILMFLVSGCYHDVPPSVIPVPQDNVYYAEGYFYNHTNPLFIDIAASGVYYNVTNFTAGEYDGFVWAGNGVTITKDGLYKFSGSLSFKGGNGGVYGFTMAINGVPQPDCSMEKTASNTLINNVGLTCLKRLSVGDHLNLQTEDYNAPAQDIYITIMTLNIIEVI